MSTQLNPWIDADFPNVDFSQHPEDLADGIIQDDPVLEPEVVQNTRPALEDEPAPAPAAAEPEAEEPESFDLKGGGQGTIEKTKKGWRVSVDVGIGGVQNFYGKTKNEAMINMANSVASGTRKIRELNRQVKLGPVTEPQAAAPVPSVVAGHRLTDDEVFDFKTKLQSNPDLAIEEWFKIRFGVDPDTLVKKSEKGERAARELEMEAVHKDFLSRCPQYFADAGYENYRTLIGWLAKNRLSRSLTATNGDAIVADLFAHGQYTAENLEEAFTDLNDSGLLIQAPRAQTATVQQPTREPAPAPTTGRIVRQETRPRAGLGIRNNEVTASAPPPSTKPLSDDDLDNLSDAQIEELYQKAVRERQLARSRR